MNNTLCLAALSTVFMIAGCANDHDHAHTHEDLVSRAELERLENEIGRLEFRLFELENQGAPSSSANNSNEELPPVQDADGTFDLTPLD